jgi:hypothetical protein
MVITRSTEKKASVKIAFIKRAPSVKIFSPRTTYTERAIHPSRNSVIGYCQESLEWQYAHLPF